MYAEHLDCLLSVTGFTHHDDVRRALYHGYYPLPHQRMIVHYQNPYPFRLHYLSPLLIEALKHMRRLLGKPTLIKVDRDDKPP